MRSLIAAVATCAAIASFAAPARAQYMPVPGPYRLLQTPLTTTMPLGDASFDLGLAYGAATEANANRLDSFLTGAVGLGPVELGLGLPVTLYHYVAPSVATTVNAGSSESPATLGDLQLHVKARLSPATFPVNLGAHAFTRFPTRVTGASDIVRDDYTVAFRAIADKTIKARFTFAGLLGYQADIGADPTKYPGYQPNPMLPTPTRDVRHSLDVGLGTQVAILRGKWDLFGELRVLTFLNPPTGGNWGYVTSTAGGKLYLPHNLTAFAALSHTWYPLERALTFVAGLTYEFRRDGKQAHLPPPDRDEDGVFDDEDQCPDEPAEEEDDPDRDGCPRHAAPEEANSPVALAHRLEDGILFVFEPGSAELAPAVRDRIAQLAPVILAHPEWPGVLVAGYSDGSGAPDEQFKLSAARAEAVRQVLVAAKVPEDRLWADGFGTAAPRRRKGEFFTHGFVKVKVGDNTAK